MHTILESLRLAVQLIAAGNDELAGIVWLSLRVSCTAVLIGALIALPLGVLLAVRQFTGARAVVLLVNTLMAMPPVVIGLLVYLLCSNAGPLGWLKLLYSPAAMICAQTILVVPIMAALTRQIVAELHAEYDELLRSLGVRGLRLLGTLLYEARVGLATIALLAFGRAISEVGAVIIVGGNIRHVTRVMTTAIALETSRGELALALALGIVLLLIALGVNALAMLLGPRPALVAANV